MGFLNLSSSDDHSYWVSQTAGRMFDSCRGHHWNKAFTVNGLSDLVD